MLEHIQFTTILSRFDSGYNQVLGLDNSQMYHACLVSRWTTYSNSTLFLRNLRIGVHHMDNSRGFRMACLSSSNIRNLQGKATLSGFWKTVPDADWCLLIPQCLVFGTRICSACVGFRSFPTPELFFLLPSNLDEGWLVLLTYSY